MSPIIHERSFCNGICIGWTLVGTAAAGCDCAGSVDQRSDLFAGLRAFFAGAVIYAVAANLGVAGVFSSVSDLMIEKMGRKCGFAVVCCSAGSLGCGDYQSRRFRSIRQLGAGKLRSGTSAQLATGFLGA